MTGCVMTGCVAMTVCVATHRMCYVLLVLYLEEIARGRECPCAAGGVVGVLAQRGPVHGVHEVLAHQQRRARRD